MLLFITSYPAFVFGCSQNEEINRILDRIDSKSAEDIVYDTGSQSGAKYLTLRQNETQYLLKWSNVAIPLMLHRFQSSVRYEAEHINDTEGGKRFEEHSAIHYSAAVILYLIIFKAARDSRVIPALADYIDLIPASVEKTLQKSYDANGNVYAYAWEAACSFVNCSSLQRKYYPDHLVQARHDLVGLLRKKAKLALHND